VSAPDLGATAACEAIAAMEQFTTADVKNIVLAMQLRIARTPLTQPERNSVAKLLAVTEAGITGIWIEGGARLSAITARSTP
jgi:hypothetical protein